MPDIEGVPYEATGGKLDQATAQALAARHREAASAGVGAASAAGASALSSAEAYTDQKVTGLATTAAMQAGDALTLSNAKAYADAQLAGFNGNGIETVSGTVTLNASGEPIREFYTTGQTSFVANGTDVQIAAYSAVVWRRTGSGSWGYQVVPDEWTTPAATPDTTAPVAGSLAVTTTDTTATLAVTGASDNRGIEFYEWSKDGGATYPARTTEPTYQFTGLAPSTSFGWRHRVGDAAGNVTSGATISKPTTAKPLVWTTVAVDSFDGAAGSIAGRVTPTGGKPWRGLALTERATSHTAGDLALDGAGSVAGRGSAGLDLATSAAVRATLTFSTSTDSQTRIGLGVKPGAGDYFFSGAQIAYFADEGFKLFYGTGTAQLVKDRAKNTTVTGPLTNAVLVVEVQGTALTATLNGTPLITNTLPASLQGSTVTLESTTGNVMHDLKVETA